MSTDPVQISFGDEDFIQEGVSPASDVFILACTVDDNYDHPGNRIIVHRTDSTLDFGTSGEAVLSIDACSDGNCYVLGENGTVLTFNWQESTASELRASRKIHANDRVNQYGPLRRLRILGNDVICAGSVGQVYKLKGQQFLQLPTLTVGDRDVTIEGLAGSSSDDFVAVTSDGFAAHFDGRQWNVLNLPTNASLTDICIIPGGQFAIVGKNGTLLLGSNDRWTVVHSISEIRSFWSVAHDNDIIYAAHLGGIDFLRNSVLAPVTIQNASALQFTGLRTGPNGVWSFAGQSVGLLKDGTWTEVVGP